MPKFKSILALLFILTSYSGLSAQTLVEVTNETLTINSVTAMTGYTRNTTQVVLPEKTKFYIYIEFQFFLKGKIRLIIPFSIY